MSHPPAATGNRLLSCAPRRRWPAAIGGMIFTLMLGSVSAMATIAPLVEPKIRAPIGRYDLAQSSLKMSRAYFFYSKWYQGYELRSLFILVADAR